MSALPKFPDAMGFAGLRMQASEFLSIGPTRERLELLDGVVMMSPSPSYWHQVVTGEVFVQLCLCRQRGAGFRAVQDVDIRFSPAHVYCPDISVFVGEPRVPPGGAIEVAPDLVVETLSPSNRGFDLVTKRQDYERFGVREYWIIDPETITARRWASRGGGFVEVPIEGDRLVSEAVAGAVVDLAELRRGLGR